MIIAPARGSNMKGSSPAQMLQAVIIAPARGSNMGAPSFELHAADG